MSVKTKQRAGLTAVGAGTGLVAAQVFSSDPWQLGFALGALLMLFGGILATDGQVRPVKLIEPQAFLAEVRVLVGGKRFYSMFVENNTDRFQRDTAITDLRFLYDEARGEVAVFASVLSTTREQAERVLKRRVEAEGFIVEASRARPIASVGAVA